MNIKKVVAREWINFLIATVAGFAVVIPLMYFFFAVDKEAWGLSDVYAEMFADLSKGYADGYGVLLMAYSPYLLYQFWRSIAWAYKTTKAESAREGEGS